MPTVLRIGPYRFSSGRTSVKSRRISTLPAVKKEAKYWLEPIERSWNRGFRSGKLTEIERIIGANLELLREAWHEFLKLG